MMYKTVSMLAWLLFGQVTAQANGSGDYSCGVLSLHVACTVANVEVGIEQVQSAVPHGNDRAQSLTDIAEGARRLGLFPVIGAARSDRLEGVPVGSILHLRSARDTAEDHFVVYLGRSGRGRIVLGDAPVPPYSLAAAEFRQRWTGYYVAIYGDQNVARSHEIQLGYRETLRLCLVAFMILCLLLCAFAAVKRTALPHKAVTSPLATALVMSSILGCGHVERSTALAFAEHNVDLGYVPPHGKTTQLRIVNRTHQSAPPFHIRTSCGCTQLGALPQVRAHGSGMLDIELIGSRFPIMKRSSILLEADDGSRDVVELTYATGDLPMVTPDVLLSETDQGLYCGTTTLWLYCPSENSNTRFGRLATFRVRTKWSCLMVMGTQYLATIECV